MVFNGFFPEGGYIVNRGADYEADGLLKFDVWASS